MKLTRKKCKLKILENMKGVCCGFHHFVYESSFWLICFQRNGCSGSLRRIIFLLVLLSLVICIAIYHTSFDSPVNTFVPTEKYNLEASTIVGDVFKKRLKVHGTQRRLPQSIIIGARKCGTRALLEMLALHPYIQKNGAEMHFFDDDDRYLNGQEWYRKKMPYSFDNQVTIEKTPSYFVSKEAPMRIRAMNESMKLLLIVRDPAQRVLSDYAQIYDSKKFRGKPVVSLQQKLLNEDGEINEEYSAIKISQYFVHMIRWLRAFPLEQIHIVDGEKLVTSPFDEIRKVEHFLRVPHRIAPWNFYYNHTKGFYCLRNETMQKCLPPTKGRKHPNLNPELLAKLRRYFAPFNEHFYELVGQNFSWPTS